MTCRSEKNVWRRRHRQFLKHHDICLKTVTLEDYIPCWGNEGFAKFFVLCAKDLESIDIKFVYPPAEFTEVFYEEQQRVLKWHNKASKHGRLRLLPSCTHVRQYLQNRSVEYLDLMDSFRCSC